MEYPSFDPSFDPEMALALLQALLYSMACVLLGAALIALSLYIVLVCSEMFFSQPRSKPRRAKALQSTRRVPVVKESLELTVAETSICVASPRVDVAAVIAWYYSVRATTRRLKPTGSVR
jgi:ABC-type tungstate transport system substrate-binding protein